MLDTSFSTLHTLVLSFTHYKVEEAKVTILDEEIEAQHCPAGKR